MAAIVVKGYRPSKHTPTPPPLYLTSPSTSTYCTTCGRLISPHRKSTLTCSARCKTHKPTHLDTTITSTLYNLLSPSRSISDIIAFLPDDLRHNTVIKDSRRQGPKGDKRLIVPCALVESVVFGRAADVNRAQGRRRNRAGKIEDAAATASEENKVGEEYDEEVLRAALARLKAGAREVVAAEEDVKQENDDGEEVEEEDDEEAEEAEAGDARDDKRREGMLRASQRERVRNACRRAVVFGLPPPNTIDPSTTSRTDTKAQPKDEEGGGGGKSGKAGRRKRGGSSSGDDTSTRAPPRCEAIMRGAVVEPSYAKGDWGVRWAEEGGA